MKKVLSLLAAAGLIAAATTAFGASIVGSKHDLTSTGTAAFSGANSQICVYCHAPHDANLSLPLWNRSNPTGSGFTLYSGVNMASRQFATGFTDDSTSLFCMSCHEGTVAMSAIHNTGAIRRTGVSAGSAGAAFAANTIGSGNAGFGKDLTKTHPINFPVPTTDVQGDLHVGTGMKMGGILPANSAMPSLDLTNAFPLFNAGKNPALATARNSDRSLECGSCHAVHDSQNSPFLRATMTGSALCLGCHNK